MLGEPGGLPRRPMASEVVEHDLDRSTRIKTFDRIPAFMPIGRIRNQVMVLPGNGAPDFQHVVVDRRVDIPDYVPENSGAHDERDEHEDPAAHRLIAETPRTIPPWQRRAHALSRTRASIQVTARR